MTFDEYTKGIDINPHIYSKVWNKVDGGNIKSEIEKELLNRTTTYLIDEESAKPEETTVRR